jgi:hypothetical protein
MKRKTKTQRPRKAVTLCKHTKETHSGRNSRKLWAFSLEDLAVLYGITVYEANILVVGRDRGHEKGRKTTKPSLDPRDLSAICDLREKRRWDALSQGTDAPQTVADKVRTELQQVRDYLELYKPELFLSVQFAITELFRKDARDLGRDPDNGWGTTRGPTPEECLPNQTKIRPCCAYGMGAEGAGMCDECRKG